MKIQQMSCGTDLTRNLIDLPIKGMNFEKAIAESYIYNDMINVKYCNVQTKEEEKIEDIEVVPISHPACGYYVSQRNLDGTKGIAKSINDRFECEWRVVFRIEHPSFKYIDVKELTY